MKTIFLILSLVLLAACTTPSGGTYRAINDPNRCDTDSYAICDMHMGKPVVCQCAPKGYNAVADMLGDSEDFNDFED